MRSPIHIFSKNTFQADAILNQQLWLELLRTANRVRTHINKVPAKPNVGLRRCPDHSLARDRGDWLLPLARRRRLALIHSFHLFPKFEKLSFPQKLLGVGKQLILLFAHVVLQHLFKLRDLVKELVISR